jgi:sterol desaturase/sphingolipid hydroxylase (fatty acid hydroxylase superfamily)
MERYRKAFRKKVIPWYYRGQIHVAIFSIIQISALFFIGSRLEWGKSTLLVIFLALGYATTFTYFLHRFLLHRKLPGFGWAFKMHHWHHTFYQSNRMEYDHLDDVYMLLMPPWIQIFYFVVYLPGLVIVAKLFLSQDLILPFAFGLTLWYGIYELIHWIEHLPLNHWAIKIPFMKSARQRHAIHHSKLKDIANFGIVEPSWDYIFKTKF